MSKMEKTIQSNVINGFYSAKRCIDRNYQGISTREVLKDITNTYKISSDQARYMIGKDIFSERTSGKSAKDIATEYNISTSTVYKYMKLQEPQINVIPTVTAQAKPIINNIHPKAVLEQRVNDAPKETEAPIKYPSTAQSKALTPYKRFMSKAGKTTRRMIIGLGIGAVIIGGTFFGGYKLGYSNCKKNNLCNQTPIVNVYNASKVNIIKTNETTIKNSEKVSICKPTTVNICKPKTVKICHPKKVEIYSGSCNKSVKQEIKSNYVASASQETKQDIRTSQSNLEEVLGAAENTSIISIVSQETEQDTRIVENTNEDTGIVSVVSQIKSYSQSDLEKMLEVRCEKIKADKHSFGYELFDETIGFNIPEMIEIDGKIRTAKYNQLRDIVSDGTKIFGDASVINTYIRKGVEFYDLPNTRDGKEEFKGLWQEKADFNGIRTAKHNYVWNDPSTTAVQKATPTGRINFSELGKRVAEAEDHKYPVTPQHIPGNSKILDGFAVQTEQRVIQGCSTDLGKLELTVQNAVDCQDKAINGPMGKSAIKAAALILPHFIGGRGGSSIIAPECTPGTPPIHPGM
jgi:hypothetical protein